YYRWSVPPGMLQALAGSGGQGLNARERVGFLNNLSALLDAGQVAGDDYLPTLRRFTEDPDPGRGSALGGSPDQGIDGFGTPGLRGSFSITTRRMLRPSLKRFGLTRTRGEPEPVSLMRPNLLTALGVYGYDPEVLDWARLTARSYLAHPESVDPTIAGTAL